MAHLSYGDGTPPDFDNLDTAQLRDLMKSTPSALTPPTARSHEPLDTPGLIPQHLKSSLTHRHPLLEILQRLIYRLRPGSKLDTLLALLALYHASAPVYTWAKNFLRQKFTSSLTISEHDPVAQEIMAWMAARVVQKGATRAMVVTGGNVRDPWDSYLRDPLGGTYSRGSGGGKGGERQVQYVPPLGTKIFWVGFRPYLFSRTGGVRSGVYSLAAKSGDGDQPQETIMITTPGWNLAPLKDFTSMCHDFHVQNKGQTTTVYFPMRGDFGPEYGSSTWSSVTKAIRKLDTIDMDEVLKQELVTDAVDYYRAETKKFYADCGIPYRRGYLFHGPPGTGKTSFSAAIAGHLGCDIYMINLSTTTITDSKLHRLFLHLPQKCILLLEDVDSAGINRDPPTPSQNPPKHSHRYPGSTPRSGITLSGLLNAIDGNASQEGRLLIMTSNTPSLLDEALLRPGRVDKNVYFGNISSRDARRSFMRLVGGFAVAGGVLSKGEAEAMAVEFGERLPDGVFTPAEVQGFLQGCRGEPGRAVEGVVGWAEGMVREKEGAREKAVREGERQKGKEKKTEKASDGAKAPADMHHMHPMAVMPPGFPGFPGFPPGSSMPPNFLTMMKEMGISGRGPHVGSGHASARAAPGGMSNGEAEKAAKGDAGKQDPILSEMSKEKAEKAHDADAGKEDTAEDEESSDEELSDEGSDLDEMNMDDEKMEMIAELAGVMGI